MINTLKEQKVTQPITYPVRAGLAANSMKVIKSLMENSSFLSNVTLTIWSSEGDKVDTETLSTLIRNIGVEKVYVDVPQDLMNKLYLSGASSVIAASITFTVSVLTGLLLTILWAVWTILVAFRMHLRGFSDGKVSRLLPSPWNSLWRRKEARDWRNEIELRSKIVRI